MVYLQCFINLLLASAVLADYYIDDANPDVIYAMGPSESGIAWQQFSVTTQSLELNVTNSTGSYIIPLDASNCYDQNYTLGVCGTGDNCFVQIPFVGSGIEMYVFSAGASGMTASFAIDGGEAVSSTIGEPPAPNYQLSNVSIFNAQGLSSGNHTMVMTILDWTGNGGSTSMKFDYAYVNETYVAGPATTSASATSTSASATPSQTSTGSTPASNKSVIGAAVGGSLGGMIVGALAVVGCLYLRKRKAQTRKNLAWESTIQTNPFISDQENNITPPFSPHFTFPAQQTSEPSTAVAPLTRSAILRDAHAVGMSQTFRTQQISPSNDTDRDIFSGASHVADAGLPLSNVPTRHNILEDQFNTAARPREDDREIAEESLSLRASVDGLGGRRLVRKESNHSKAPPSYMTRDR